MKPGYKQTEIGVIPEDWEVGSLKQAFPRLDAGVSVNSDDSESSDYYILKTSAVRNGNVNIKEAKPVIRSDYARLKCAVKKGSIIISRMNTPAMVGECGFSTIDAPNTFLPDRLWQIEPSSPDYNFQWLNYLLNTEKYSTAIRATATGTSNSMKNIAKERLLEISIPKPPFPEQNRIAEALSDVDELIASLEKLIEKKKAIKQGAMQELLTGKRRLPGYSAEWKSYLYSDICSLLNGRAYSQPELLNEGKYKVLRLGNLFTNEKWYYSDLELPEKQYCDTGDLIFAWSATFGPYIWEKERVIYHYHIWKVICSELVDKQFLYYYFLYDTQKIKNEVQGGTMAHLTKEAMEKRLCLIPGKTEQEEIGHILTTLDEDIKKYELKLEKAQQIKQGMMQQLLTGKNRLS